MMKPLLQHLFGAAANLPFFVVAFLLFALHVLFKCFVLFKPPLQVYNFTLRRFRVSLLHYLINYCLFLYYFLSFAGVFISLLRCKGSKKNNTLQTFYQKSLYFYLSLTRNEEKIQKLR